MVKVIDRLILFILSLAALIGSGFAIALGTGWIAQAHANEWLDRIYNVSIASYSWLIGFAVVFIISLRVLYISLRRNRDRVSSINQRTEHGDIQISLDTVENLALKAAGRVRGIKDLKARIKVGSSGLEMVIRTIVDGESSIPALTEEVQSQVKAHVEEITGIPVSEIAVFVANIAQSQPTFKSRVE